MLVYSGVVIVTVAPESRSDKASQEQVETHTHTHAHENAHTHNVLKGMTEEETISCVRVCERPEHNEKLTGEARRASGGKGDATTTDTVQRENRKRGGRCKHSFGCIT